MNLLKTAVFRIPGKALYVKTGICNRYDQRKEYSSRPVQMDFAMYESNKTDHKLPPIIIMHGLFGSKQNWRGISKALVTKLKRKIYAVDARNHGDSPHTAEHSFLDMAADVVQFMKDREIEKAVLMGHSMGGRSMMYTAMKYPELVERGIIVDISPLDMPRDFSYMEDILHAMKNVNVSPKLSMADGRKHVESQISDAVGSKETVNFIMMNLRKRDGGEFYWAANVDSLLKNLKTFTEFTSQIKSLPAYQGPMMFLCGTYSNFVEFLNFLVVAVASNATILNYTSSHYIPISDGQVAVYDTYKTLAHITNLNHYATLVGDTQAISDRFPKTQIHKLLQPDLEEIGKTINALRIHHRHARSINMIGSELKFIGGTPDYDDFNELRSTQNELIYSNNKQIIINTETQLLINNLTQTVNLILNVTKIKDVNTEGLYNLLNNRNKAIMRELDSVALSVALGKANIINPTLLDLNEINFILTSENNINISSSEIIANSKLKILQNEDIMTFLIKFPVISSICNKKLILPVIHVNKILSFESRYVAKCANDYVILTNCTKNSITSFCKPLSSAPEFCLKNLLNNNSATCNSIPPLTSLMTASSS